MQTYPPIWGNEPNLVGSRRVGGTCKAPSPCTEPVSAPMRAVPAKRHARRHERTFQLGGASRVSQCGRTRPLKCRETWVDPDCEQAQAGGCPPPGVRRRSCVPRELAMHAVASAPTGHSPGATSAGNNVARTQELFGRCETASGEEREQLHAEIVLLNRGLADKIAGRYRNRGIPLEDLRQVAYVGLCKAVQRYRLSRGTYFSSYAAPTISGEIKRHFRDQGWMIRVPRRVQELRAEMNAAEHSLTQALGQSPTVPQMAAELGVREDDVIEALAAGSSYSPLQLDLPGVEGDSSLADMLAVTEDGLADRDAGLVLAPILKRLSDQERDLIRMRFFEELTQRQIGERLGVSQMQVSRLLSSLLQRLREQLGVSLAG